MERERERPDRDPYEGLEVRIRRRPSPESDRLTTWYANRAAPTSRRGNDRPVGGFWRRNRSLTLTLIDVAIVLVLFVIYWFVLRPTDWQTQIDGFRFRAVATIAEGQVDIRVRIDAPTAIDTRAGPVTRVVSIHAADTSRYDLAPGPDRRRYLHLRIAPPASLQRTPRIEIEVGLDDQRERLRVPLRTGPRIIR